MGNSEKMPFATPFNHYNNKYVYMDFFPICADERWTFFPLLSHHLDAFTISFLFVVVLPTITLSYRIPLYGEVEMSVFSRFSLCPIQCSWMAAYTVYTLALYKLQIIWFFFSSLRLPIRELIYILSWGRFTFNIYGSSSEKWVFFFISFASIPHSVRYNVWRNDGKNCCVCCV